MRKAFAFGLAALLIGVAAPANASTKASQVVISTVSSSDGGTTYDVVGYVASDAVKCEIGRTVSLTHDDTTALTTATTDSLGDWTINVPASFITSGGSDIIGHTPKHVIKKHNKKTVCAAGDSSAKSLVVNLTVTPYLSGGSISIDAAPGSTNQQIVALRLGHATMLSETPQPGFVFGGWSGDCSGNASTCNFTVTHADPAVTANYGFI